MKYVKPWTALVLSLLLCLLSLTGCGRDSGGLSPAGSSLAQGISSSANADSASPSDRSARDPAEAPVHALDENASYTSKEDVSLYLYTYGRLPDNFITKKEARDLGWEGGSLEPYAPGKCIGGDRFGNYEGILPDGDYRECDIDTLGAERRGAKRLVFSDDGSIYYTEDHYESFELLYGEA